MSLASYTEDSRRFRSDSMPLLQRLVRGEAALLLAILLIATAFRFVAIGSKSFWFDEAYSAFIASQSPRALIHRIQTEDAHPPLYYLLLSGWGRLVGTGDVELRSLGAIISLFTVAGTWWIGRRLGGSTVGAVAAFIVAASPFEVVPAQEARMYPLLGLLTVLSWAALLAASENRRAGWIAYVIATTLALYTHYLAMMLIIAQGVFVLITGRSVFRKWVGCLLIVGVLFAPWVSTFVTTWAAGRGWPFFRPAFGAAQLVQLFGMLGFGGYAFGSAGWLGGSNQIVQDIALALPFWILGAIGAITLRTRRRVLGFLASYLFIPIVVAALYSLRHNIFYSRYFSFVHPAFALFSAFGIVSAATWVSPHIRRALVLTAVLLVLAISSLALQAAYSEPQYNPYNWRSVAATISAEASPTDLIVVTPEFATVAFSRYFRGPQRIIGMSPVELVDKTRAPSAGGQPMRPQFKEYARDHEVLWIVLTVPFPPAAFSRLERLLVGIYDLEQVGEFTGITVHKLRRHAP